MSENVPHHTPCAKCQSLLKREDRVEESKEIEYTTVDELLKSAETGCQLCALVSGRIKAKATEEGRWEYVETCSLIITVRYEAEYSNGMIISASSKRQKDTQSRYVILLFLLSDVSHQVITSSPGPTCGEINKSPIQNCRVI